MAKAHKLQTSDEPAAIVPGGKELMDENPQSRQAEDKNKQETNDITKKVKKTLVVPTPEARTVRGFDCVMPVDRKRPEDSPESARQKNNRSRDMRTNLGRGKPSSVVTE